MPLASDYTPGRVSVIIISFNYGHFINHAIQSVLSQEIVDLEIIVVDDGSTDGTDEIVKPYKDRVKFIYQNNRGQSAARNKGLENCSGEFIQFLDSDDILGAGKIRTQLEYFRSHSEVSVVVCPTKLFKKVAKNGKPQAWKSWYLFKDNLDLYLCFYNIAPPHAFLFRREVILQTGMMDSTVDNCEDYDFLLRAASRGYTPRYTPACVVYYRRHSKSVTANAIRQYLTDVKMHKRLGELLDQNSDFPDNHRLEGLLAYCAGAIKTAARLHPFKPEKSDELLGLAVKHMLAARAVAKVSNKEWNFPIQLFSMKIITSLALAYFKNNSSALTIRTSLANILQSVHGPTTTLGLISDSIQFLLRKKHDHFIERLLIGYISFQYLANLLFPYAYRLKSRK
jgi:glycosyltransferase involved in cell wall biosynthesis